MSVRLSGTTIVMTRGDTCKIKVDILNPDGTNYTPINGDKIRFALKESYTDLEPLILKNIPYDTCELVLDPEDTKCLEQPKDYVYDIQITLPDGTVDTFIPKGRLKLTEEVD